MSILVMVNFNQLIYNYELILIPIKYLDPSKLFFGLGNVICNLLNIVMCYLWKKKQIKILKFIPINVIVFIHIKYIKYINI